jgi:pyruvate/2-oxoglutarate dehydrogenase complex dihydrolipoamide acyltransferase (E2) component
MIKLLVPQWGLTMDSAVVQKWLKAPGDQIRKGEPVVVIDTDKVSSDVVSPADGILAQILAPPGSEVKPGQALADINQQ